MQPLSHTRSRIRKPAGVALFLVLAFLALIITLVLAFFTSVTSELSAARSAASEVTAKQLGDTAVQVVSSVIRMATSSSSKSVSWASQPGMIRTYGKSSSDAASTLASPLAFFKLYSSDDMEATYSELKAGFDPTDDLDGQWDLKPAQFTDLNSPVTDNAGKLLFPIIDPRAQTAPGTSLVDGFSYGDTAVGKMAVKMDLVNAGGSGADNQRLPMPVKWIYVLRDGTLTAPRAVDATGKIANWTGESNVAKTPSASNPIVGRIAFWTDDESCKINVNTASEPTAWDTPRAVCIQDLNYGKFQPANKEFQRYPGHPFMTALSPVFFPGTPSAMLTPAQRKAIYDFVPRVQEGGSTSGTVIATAATAVTPDNDRLFANIDECLFSAAPPSGPLRVKSDVRNSGGTNIFTTDFLNQRRFFLTASSRAPELNLFGRPRISLWPEGPAARRTAYDKLAAFCATLGSTSSQSSYFQRADPLSPTNDWNNLARNQVVYKYLQTMTDSVVPGFGGDFKTKLGNDRDQVLTEIFDYIRCINLRDNSTGATQFTANGQVAPIRIDNADPSKTTKGFGRFHSISQFGIQFICGQDGPSGLSTVTGSGVTALPAGQRYLEASLLFEPFSPSLGYHELHESLSYEVTVKTPMTVNGTDLQFPAGMVTKSSNNSFGGIFHGRYWGGAQGIRGMIKSFGSGSNPLVSMRTQVAASGANPTMAFSGGTVEVKVYAGTTPSAANLVQTFTFTLPKNDTFPVPKLVTTGTEAYRGCVATTTDTWWSFAKRYAGVSACPHAPGSEYADSTRRWGANSGTGWKQGGVFRAEDVVRTMVPENGDIRLIAAQSNPPSSLFVKGSRYDDNTRMIDHLFQEPQGPHMLYGFGNEPKRPSDTVDPQWPTSAAGDQLTAAIYHYARNPEITPGAGKKYNKWNDFDNGFAHLTDGAYINKPDEGNIASQNSSYPYFAWDFVGPTLNLFSPNRLVPSAGMLGSLPTGVKRNQPWQTLLFRPDVTNTHPGTQAPKDHLLMDLFWMPVIEPYAVSEPFSTAGKINLNYAIAPFSYIRRATGLYGAMKSEEPLLIPNNASTIYKLWDHETNDWPSYPNNAKDSDPVVRSDWDKLYKGLAPFDKLRRPINMEETLKQFDARFTAGDIFRSASEICEMHLVRDGEMLSDYTANKIWPNNLVTGENTRERPYTNIYARTTTKSNVYTVHFRVQVLRKARSTKPAQWDEIKDSILSEHRGSSIIERYVDAADTALPDFITDTTKSVDAYYRFRVLSTKKF